MKPGEQFEIQCFDYLTATYGRQFIREGGMDPSRSDIAFVRDGTIDFYIEAKDSQAQSGQFVVLPESQSNSFYFSTRNHSQPNEFTSLIINYMNQHFELFNTAGTKGQPIDLDQDVFSKWIISHYRDLNVKYVISYKDGFVIFPLDRFSYYFHLSAKYRVKKSGSSKPSKKALPALKECISQAYPSASISFKQNALYASISEQFYENKFKIDNSTYYLSKKEPGLFEARKLSNTYNMNVIFSISIKHTQEKEDLEVFEAELQQPTHK